MPTTLRSLRFVTLETATAMGYLAKTQGLDPYLNPYTIPELADKERAAAWAEGWNQRRLEEGAGR